MGVIANQERFHALTGAIAAHAVESCLPYPGMVSLPSEYSEFAQRDALERELDWEDVCPAYALAAISFGAYSLPKDDEEMETLWDELGGASSKVWNEVRDLIPSSWTWLAEYGYPS